MRPLRSTVILPETLRVTAIAVKAISAILRPMHCSDTQNTSLSLLRRSLACAFCGAVALFFSYGEAVFAEESSPRQTISSAPRVDSYTVTQRGDGYRVSISYPQTGNPVADAELAIWAQGQATAFTHAVRLIPTSPPIPYELSISYKTEQSPPQIVSVAFFINTAMGGPHPEPGLATFVYDKRDGRRLSYADIFMNQETITHALSEICRKALKEKLGDRADDAMLQAGTAPDMANFDLFTLVKEGIRIYFPPYQAASYNEGYLDVTIPLGDLAQFKPHLAFWDRP